MSKKFKSIGSVFMAFCLSVTMSSTSLFAVVADAIEKSSVEEATQEDFKDVSTNETEESKEASSEQSTTLGWYDSEKTSFTISSEDDLVLLSRIVNGTAEDAGGNKVQDSFKGKNIILDEKLDLTKVKFQPVGSQETPFEGTFNGQNNKISINISSEKDYQAIFGYNKGTIKKLVVEGSVTGGNYVSAVAGYNAGEIQNIKSSVVIKASGDNVGAIAGKNDGIVDRCSNSADLTANHFLGGIVGYNTAIVSKSYNTGNITGTGTNEVYNTLKGVGGVTGVSYGINDWKCKINQCYNTGTINGHYMVGGLTGWTQYATVINSYNTGDVTGVWDIGGISGTVKGLNTTDTLVVNCYNTGHVKSTREYAGGIAGFVWACTLDNCYNSGEITGVSENGGIFGGDYHGGGGLVKNCKTTGKVNPGNYTGDVFGWSSGVSHQNNEYFSPTSENFEKIVGLLNAQVTADNGYLGWKYKNNAITQAQVYDVEFDLNPLDATVVVKNSEGNEINASDEGLYCLVDGTYTYEVSKENYVSKTNTFTVNGSSKSIYVKLIKSSDLWDGESVDTDWYNDTDTSFNISTNSQLAGLIKLIDEGKDFTDKTIALSNDVNLNDKALPETDKEFNGTFDGASYVVEGLNGSLFKVLGQNAIVINLGIKGNGEIANINKGTVANSYSLTDSSLVSNNEGTVKNCYSSSNQPIVKSGTQAVDSYYIDGEIYKNEDLTNSKIADLLNKNVTAKNNTYYSWIVSKEETVLAKSYKASFDIISEGTKINDAKIALYDSNDSEITVDSAKNYIDSDNSFRLVNGKYAYKITCEGYIPKTGYLKINGKDIEVSVELAASYNISFVINQEGSTVVVKDSQDNVLEPKEDGIYSLQKGDYTYEVSKEGYWTEKGKFTVSKDQAINVNLSQTYDLVFNLNIENPEGLKINVVTEDGEDVAPQADGLTYKLRDGKYTYSVNAKGYKGVAGEIQVAGQPITQEINLEASYDTSWYDSTKDSFVITRGSQLAGLAVLVNGINSDALSFEGKTITLANDISLNEKECDWLPIGTYENQFKGNFDGNNHTISNLLLNRVEDERNIPVLGLFGYISKSTLKNITIEGNINGKTYVGALAGTSSDSNIENCTNKADVSANNSLGGLIGQVYRTNIKNCTNEGKIEAKNGAVGGIAGSIGNAGATEGNNYLISNCTNKGTIIANANSCGGIAGSFSGSVMYDCVNQGNIQGVMYIGGISGSIGNANIINSYNTGSISGGTKGATVYIGGITGRYYCGTNSKIYLGNCYNLGNIKTDGKGAGGIVGYAENYIANGEIYNCYNLGTVSAQSNSAAIAGMTFKPNIYDCYYLDTTGTDSDTKLLGENASKTETEFKDGTVADLLNKNLTSQNGFKLWEVVDNITTFSDKKVNIFSFNVSPSDATVTLKDSNGQIVSKLNDKNTYINLKENEKYTYTVEKENYIAKTEEFTYTLENNLIDVALSYRPTKIVFNKTPQDAKITLYDNSNKVVEANEDGSYTLLPGEYKYYVEAEGYGPIVESFTVEEVNEDTTKEISVELEKAYNVTLKTDSTTDENITVYDKDKNVINPNEDNIYTLSAGTYSYEIVADGYENYSGSFEVVDKDIEIYNKLVKVYDLSWYDKDKTEFIINDKYELKGMAAILSGTSTVSKDDFAGKTIKLAKNIDLNSKDLFTTNENGTITVSKEAETWVSIPLSSKFAGTFDGQGHSIDGLYKPGGFGGLFTTVSGTVKNITVSGYIKATMRGGGIAAQGLNARFENCVNKCMIDGKAQSAGVVPYNSMSTIVNCTNEGYVKGSTSVGGISGLSTNSTFVNCINKGTVEATTDASGIAGNCKSISNCYNLGDIIAPTSAGISIGTSATINNCINYGTVTGTKSAGAISTAKASDTMVNNYYLKGSCSQGVSGDDVEGQVEAKSAKQLADGSVAALLNAKVTDVNDYKSWAVIDGKTVFGSCDLSITASVQGATVKLYDYKGNEVKAIQGTTGTYDNLRKGSLYKYEVTKEGLNTETGTVIIGNTPQTIYVELSATVYVTISKDGEFKLADDDETTLTRIPVTTTNFDVTDYGYPSVYNSDEYPTLLNVFIRFHELYAGGADNFAGTPNNTPAKGNDLFINKFLGIDTTQLNYYVNNKYPGEWLEEEGYIWGSTADYIKMKNNDDVNVVMFTNYQTPMFYTYFDKQEATVEQGQNLELTLNGFDNSQAYLAPEEKSISGATIYIDGEATDIVTDKDGKATLMFDEPGTYIVSAQGTDLSLSDSEETVITAPVCEVTVTEADDITVSFDADNGEAVISKVTKPGKVFNYMPTAPTKEGYTFVGWYKDTDDTTTEYKQGTRYTESVTYKAKWAHVTMLGAQGKLVVDGKSGIRFGTKLYNDGDEIIEKGTLIIPANLLAEGEALTLDTPKAARSIGKTNYEVNKEQNYVTYLGTISNIPEDQFEREMTAAAYVTYKDKAGNEYTVYSQYPNGSISVLDLLGNDIDWNEKW